MLDYSLIKEAPEKVRFALSKKKIPLDFNALLALDEKRRSLIAFVDDLRNKQKRFSKAVASLSQTDKVKKMSEMKFIASELKEKQKELTLTEEEFRKLWLYVPNIPADEVPDGASDAENKQIKEWGREPDFDFKPKGHEELIKTLGIADIDRAVKVSGNKFYYLVGKGVILEMALMRFAMDKLVKAGFTPLMPPDLVRADAMYGAAHFPPEEDAYAIERDELFLTGTAEVGLACYHKDETLKVSELPKKYCGYSACFRREAGSYGRKGGGLYRVHQFHKIEMFVYAKPESSETEHQKLLGVAEEIMRELELPYRVVLNCGGDLGLPQYKKYDIEAWIPSSQTWGETHSCSNDTDYQARRLGIKFETKDGKKEFVHTLNNTAIASPRILIPLLEIHQQRDGSVKIPEALRKYTGFDKIEPISSS